MSKTAKKCLAAAPALLWYGLIWSFSAQTATQSGGMSGGLLHTLLSLLSSAYRGSEGAVQRVSVEILSFFVRKGAHMFLYFVLTGLLLLALSHWMNKTAQRRGTALALCAMLAGLDEFHQTFVPGRSGELRDVCIDTVGGAIFLLLWALLVCLWTKSKTDRRPILLMGGAAGLLDVFAVVLPWGLGCWGLPLVEALGQSFVEEWSRFSAETQRSLAAGALPVAAQSLRACLAAGAVFFALLAGMAVLRWRK